MSKEVDVSHIKPSEVENYARLGAPDTEIADMLGITPQTLVRRFDKDLAMGRAKRRLKLRQKQTEVALAGNVTMLIWLGKNDLGQKDTATLTVNRNDIADLDDEELERVASGIPISKVLAARATRG